MIITKTPLRISLLGGNTDFPKYFNKHGGAVLTATIDKYVYCIVKRRFDNQIWINYSIKEKVTRIEDIKHDLVREALRLIPTYGIEITFLSDIPSEGSGLGSSSAVVIGLLNALHTLRGVNRSARDLAEEAISIEINTLKKPIGYQDQYAIAFGGFNLIKFSKNSVNLLSINPEGVDDYLILLYTGITRKAEKVLSKLKLKKKILDRIKLEVYKKLDHITDPVILGDLLDRYWVMKKTLNKAVTNPKIDKMYLNCLRVGALGGKIVGAGAGGFLLVAVLPEDRKSVKDLGYRELPFKFSKYGSQVIFNIQ